MTTKPPTLLKRARPHWPLWAVLIIQAALTIPWLTRYGASSDEALYLLAGREEWAHWITHAPMSQNFPAVFSGSIFIWPPLGAIGDGFAGIAGARAISMLLLLAVTALTYFTGLRMANRRLVAGFAAALAGLTGLETYLGASATFEPLALFFLMLAVYLVIRASGNWRLLIAAGAVLALSNAAKYGTIAWDPVVLGMTLFYSWKRWLSALYRILIVTGCLALGDTLLLLAGGSSSLQGLKVTTLARSQEPSTIASPMATVIAHSAALVGVVLFLALFGIVMSRIYREPWAQTGLLSVMTVSLLIAPIDQARLYQLPSLDRNVAIGLPIGALAAAFGVGYGIRLTGRRFGKSPYALRAAWALPVIAMLVFGVTHPWAARSPAGDARVAAFIQRSYRSGTYVGSLQGGDVNVERLYIDNIPDGSWIFMSQHRFVGLLRANQMSVMVLRYWKRKPGAEADVIRLLEAIRGWRLAHNFGQGAEATQVWCFRPAAKQHHTATTKKHSPATTGKHPATTKKHHSATPNATAKATPKATAERQKT
jgi:hypothetical protein